MSKHLQFLVLISSFFIFAFYFNVSSAATTPVNPLGVKNTTSPGYFEGLKNMVFTASDIFVKKIKNGINGGKKDETKKDEDDAVLDLGGNDDLGTSTASTTKNLFCPSDDPMVGCPLTDEQIQKNKEEAERKAAEKNQQPPPPPPPPKEPPKMPELPKGGEGGKEAKENQGMKEEDEPKDAKGRCKDREGEEGCEREKGKVGRAKTEVVNVVTIEAYWYDLFFAKVYAKAGGQRIIWFPAGVKVPKAGDRVTQKDTIVEDEPLDYAFKEMKEVKKGGQVKLKGFKVLNPEGEITDRDNGSEWASGI